MSNARNPRIPFFYQPVGSVTIPVGGVGPGVVSSGRVDDLKNPLVVAPEVGAIDGYLQGTPTKTAPQFSLLKKSPQVQGPAVILRTSAQQVLAGKSATKNGGQNVKNVGREESLSDVIRVLPAGHFMVGINPNGELEVIRDDDQYSSYPIQIRVSATGVRSAFFFSDGDWRPFDISAWRSHFKGGDRGSSIADGSLSLSLMAGKPILFDNYGLSPRKKQELVHAISNLSTIYKTFLENGYDSALCEIFAFNLEQNQDLVGHIENISVYGVVLLLNQILGYADIAVCLTEDGGIEAVDLEQELDASSKYSLRFKPLRPGVFAVYLKDGEVWRRVDPSHQDRSLIKAQQRRLSQVFSLPHLTADESESLADHLEAAQTDIWNMAWTAHEFDYYEGRVAFEGPHLAFEDLQKVLQFAAHSGYLVQGGSLGGLKSDSRPSSHVFVAAVELYESVFERGKKLFTELADQIVRQNLEKAILDPSYRFKLEEMMGGELNEQQVKLYLKGRFQLLVKQVLNLLACDLVKYKVGSIYPGLAPDERFVDIVAPDLSEVPVDVEVIAAVLMTFVSQTLTLDHASFVKKSVSEVLSCARSLAQTRPQVSFAS